MIFFLGRCLKHSETRSRCWCKKKKKFMQKYYKPKLCVWSLRAGSPALRSTSNLGPETSAGSVLVKDTIEPMKWTNELFQQFRKYQQISQKLENFLQINIFSVFSENFWTFREILGKIHQHFAEKWQNFENFVKNFEKNASKFHEVFPENLRSERCKGMHIL